MSARGSRPGPSAPDRESHGDRRRRQILAAAADVASAEGLEGLSIGRLAREVGMSKSGVASHFESKQDLQLLAVEEAAAGYESRVLHADVEPGLERALALMGAWIEHVETVAYRGGCFFAATGAEFASRPGAVRDRIARHTRSLIRALERELRTAVRTGELAPSCEPRLLAFQLHALVQEANLRRTLLDEPGAFDDARALVARAFERAAPPTTAKGGRR